MHPGSKQVSNVYGLFQAKVSRRNDAFDDLKAPVGTYELRSYGGEQVKQPPH